MLKDHKVWKIKWIKELLEKEGIHAFEKVNGHLKIDHIDFWATTEKFYDSKTGVKDTGINSFIQYYKSTYKG